jgi:YggT family protein
MLNPFIDLLANAIEIYMVCLIVWAVLATLISFKIVNAYQPVVQKVMYALDKICLPALRPIQKILPDLGGIDISPIVLLLLLNFAKQALYTYLYNL